jgi:puromycin-sensitive aminopeptidase
MRRSNDVLGQTSHIQKTQVALTVAHEVAHQWFGNLVTMEWWTGLWLNEGFAHFMEYEAVHAIFPEWNIWSHFIQDVTLDSAFHDDARQMTHEIEVDVGHPDEAEEIFDNISYCKGASIVRMVCTYVGRDVFYRGIQDYLKT